MEHNMGNEGVGLDFSYLEWELITGKRRDGKQMHLPSTDRSSKWIDSVGKSINCNSHAILR